MWSWKKSLLSSQVKSLFPFKILGMGEGGSQAIRAGEKPSPQVCTAQVGLLWPHASFPSHRKTPPIPTSPVVQEPTNKTSQNKKVLTSPSQPPNLLQIALLHPALPPFYFQLPGSPSPGHRLQLGKRARGVKIALTLGISGQPDFQKRSERRGGGTFRKLWYRVWPRT